MKSDKITIRNFQKTDQQKIYQFFLDIFEELEWPMMYGKGLKDTQKHFNLPEGIFIIAEHDGELVGTAGVKKLIGQTGLIKRFFVRKNLRGTGLALRLLNELIKQSKEKDFDTLILDTGKSNHAANKFYSKHGFKLFTPDVKLMEVWDEAGDQEKFNYYKFSLK